jgi:hypothetical protein
MTNKFLSCCIIAILFFGGSVIYQDQSALANATGATSDLSAENRERTAPSSFNNNADKSKILTLNFLRDTGLSLQQIEQQSINVYLEVTRRDVQPRDKFELVYPKSISDKELSKTLHYLQPRSEWLYYYVGTMEPIIHLFAQDVSDTKAGVTRVFVPKAIKTEMSPLWQEWSIGIQNLNEHLSAIYQLVNEDKLDNIAIGKHAVAMFKIGKSLENTRQKAVDEIRKSERHGIQSEPVGIQ